jgi:hypothetical protein
MHIAVSHTSTDLRGKTRPSRAGECDASPFERHLHSFKMRSQCGLTIAISDHIYFARQSSGGPPTQFLVRLPGKTITGSGLLCLAALFLWFGYPAISQAIHQVDLLLHLIGAVSEVSAFWQLGGTHAIESEDQVSALLRFASGAIGVLQASTSFWPGYPERIEIHGTKGTAIITGDQLTTWDVQDDNGDPAPVAQKTASGASDPMAISLAPFERQFLDFGQASREGRAPACSGEDGYRALQLVRSIYMSCADGRKVNLSAGNLESEGLN